MLSPALSVHSDHSHSPNASSNKQSITITSNHKTNTEVIPVLGSSSQNHSIEAVPRTYSSNKRLRKDDSNDQHNYQQPTSGLTTTSESFVKKQRLNGENMSGNLNLQVPSPTFKDRISDHFVESSTDLDDSGPKKRGRKKGSKSMKKQPVLEDRVKEKLASISRNPKLKTTQELLADLRARGTNSSVNSSALPSQSVESPSMEDILRSSNEQISKFLRCTQNNSSHRNASSEALPECLVKSMENSHDVLPKYQESSVVCKEKSVTNLQRNQPEPCQDLTVEEILAKLPPIDPSSIDWSECENESAEDQNSTEFLPREITAEDIERLHTQCVEGLNGNFQPKLSSLTSTCNEEPEAKEQTSEVNGVNSVYSQPGEEFREWHQMLMRPSYDGQILHILPYVIID